MRVNKESLQMNTYISLHGWWHTSLLRAV
ncbi:trp operon leader peptide [Serratia ureilytica]|nr:trp operon leader peptide [Serratia ureilytica]MBH3121536.1 trp operon leader peptide [Serratia ureilytica]MBH3155316.1 trp operon leader peptide [Serratia ureilytica]MBH3250409.1 trp operon leader peptide [Serratia ureilytica]MBO1807395.1 trp operon leader peptide [Serratia ureilytica]